MKVIKWVRKNNRKIMAFVVIGCLFAFIGGGELLQLIASSRTQPVGHYGDNVKMTNVDLVDARSELEMLTGLGAPMFLRSQQIHGVLLEELLFSDRRPQPEVINYLNQLIMSSQYRITDAELTAVYKGTLPSTFYWILLSREADKAGIKVSNNAVGQMLGVIIPQVFRGQTYAQRMAMLMRNGMSESQILTACGKLMSILQYSQLMCSDEDLTCSQIDHLVSRDNETLDSNMVALEAGAFAKLADPNKPVAEERLAEQLSRYKGYWPGQITSDNPSGFGYKLPARIQVEYLVVQLSDVRPLIAAPTAEQAQDYYQRNVQNYFTRQVPSDPNDPNSPTKDVVRSYAEVSDEIQKRWVSEKVMDKAAAILQEARPLVDLPISEMEAKTPDLEQLKQKAPAYKPVADQLSTKYKVKVYTGQTGLLSEDELMVDRVLSRLSMTGRTPWPLSLTRLLFSVDPIDAQDLMTVNTQKPRLYETIGPATEQRGPENSDVSGEVMALLRITDAVQAREPANLNETYNNTAVTLVDSQTQPSTTFSVRDKVVQDIRQLDAYEMARVKAQELQAMVKADGWTKALDQFNQKYREQAHQAAGEPNAFAVRTQAKRRLVSTGQVQMWAVRSEKDPSSRRVYHNIKVQKVLTDQLYSLIPQDGDKLTATPAVLECQPQWTIYCIKDLALNRFSLEEYVKARAMYAFQEEFVQSQSLAPVEYDPANIAQRLRYAPVKESQTSDANKAAAD